MPPEKDFQVNIHKNNDSQNVPQWNGFHAALFGTPSRPSAIGYVPCIPAPLTEKSVVYTLLLNTATMLNRTGPENPVLTLDNKIYAFARKAQWSKLDRITIRLGRFHRVNNFVGVIGKRMTEYI